MDTDGFLNDANAGCACISERLIDNLAEIFMKFNLNISRSCIQRSGNRRQIFYIRVLRKSLEDYIRDIGFSNLHKSKKLEFLINKNGAAQIRTGIMKSQTSDTNQVVLQPHLNS